MVTISMVVPTVLDLNTHLLQTVESRTHCRQLAIALRQSLLKRFSSIFARTKMVEENGNEDQFDHVVYFLAAMLDPQFGLNWVIDPISTRVTQLRIQTFKLRYISTLIPFKKQTQILHFNFGLQTGRNSHCSILWQ